VGYDNIEGLVIIAGIVSYVDIVGKMERLGFVVKVTPEIWLLFYFTVSGLHPL
jgi:hypothetical protein